MSPSSSSSVADDVLDTQLTIAWAGEALSEPRRLGWWKTDLIDEDGGGDFLKRLLPRSFQWTGFELVREAARRVDELARRKMADRDSVRTLFHLGFEWDQRIGERLAHHKASGKSPAQALPLLLVARAFDKKALVDWIAALRGDGAHKVSPGGRQLKGKPPEDRDVMVKNLAAALLPFAPDYPVPFYRLGR